MSGGSAGDTKATETSIGAASLSVTYSEGSSVNLDDQLIVPSWSGSKDITITNNSEVDVDYVIKFLATGDDGVDGETVKGYANTFDDLYYKLEDTTKDKGTSTVTSGLTEETKLGKNSLKDTDDDDKNVLVTGHLQAGHSYTFKLTLTFKENGNQDEQKGATFTGKLYAEAFTAKPKN